MSTLGRHAYTGSSVLCPALSAACQMYTSCDRVYLREGVRRGEEDREGEVQVRWYTVTADPPYRGVP